MRNVLAMTAIAIGLALAGVQETVAEDAVPSGDTLDRTVLPIPPGPFEGKIGKSGRLRTRESLGFPCFLRR
jgi:hypothetical protein